MRSRLKLAVLLLAVLLLVTASCGGREIPGNHCSKLCEHLLPKLINNFGVTAEQLDCGGPKWNVDCEQCYKYFRDTFLIQIEPGTCESL